MYAYGAIYDEEEVRNLHDEFLLGFMARLFPRSANLTYISGCNTLKNNGILDCAPPCYYGFTEHTDNVDNFKILR
jgi:hypothetical protein